LKCSKCWSWAFFQDLIIWYYFSCDDNVTIVIWNYDHIGLHSFEATFTWETFIKTIFIWDHNNLMPHSLQNTFIWKYVHCALCSSSPVLIFCSLHHICCDLFYIIWGKLKVSQGVALAVYSYAAFSWWLPGESKLSHAALHSKLNFHWDLLCCEYVSPNRAFYLIHQNFAITYFGWTHYDECEYLLQQYLHLRLFQPLRLSSCFKPATYRRITENDCTSHIGEIKRIQIQGCLAINVCHKIMTVNNSIVQLYQSRLLIVIKLPKMFKFSC